MSSKDNPAQALGQKDMSPARETGEEHGKIKRPQQTDATMAGKDLPRGSEPETRAASGRRGQAARRFVERRTDV